MWGTVSSYNPYTRSLSQYMMCVCNTHLTVVAEQRRLGRQRRKHPHAGRTLAIRDGRLLMVAIVERLDVGTVVRHVQTVRPHTLAALMVVVVVIVVITVEVGGR